MKMFRRNDEEAVSPVIAIILMVAITVVLASVLYVWVMNLAQTDEEVGTFPQIELTLKDAVGADTLTVKHIQGDPLDWTGYKMIITNQTDTTDTAVITDLSGLSPNQITAGETSTITESISGFNDIEYQKGKAYQIEIYNLKENKRVYNRDNVICE